MQLNIAPDRASPSPQNICSRPLTGSANRGQTVNSRRAQVRREIQQALLMASRTGANRDAVFVGLAEQNLRRLAPNWGTWIKGGTSRADGNYLYGAITDELGISLSIATGFGNAAEITDDILDRLGLGGPPDESFGPDPQAAKDQIAAGAQCSG